MSALLGFCWSEQFCSFHVSLFRHSSLTSGKGSPKQYLMSNTMYCFDYDQYFNKIYVKDSFWNEPLKTLGKSDWSLSLHVIEDDHGGRLGLCSLNGRVLNLLAKEGTRVGSWWQCWLTVATTLPLVSSEQGCSEGLNFSEHFCLRPLLVCISWEHIRCLLLLK